MDCGDQDCCTCQPHPDCCQCNPCCNPCSSCPYYSTQSAKLCTFCTVDRSNKDLDAELCKNQQRRVKDDTPKNINIRFSSTLQGGQTRFKSSPQPVSLRKKGKSKAPKDDKLGKSVGKIRASNKNLKDSKTSRGRSGKKPRSKKSAKSKSSKSKKRTKKSKSASKTRKSKKGGKSKSKSASKARKSKKGGKSKSKSSSKSRSKSKGRKGTSKNKSPRGKKKARGRSKKKSGRKPRGPPPTPVTTDTRKAQTQYFERLEKFNKFRLEQGLQEIALIHELRGYCSEPEMTIPCEQKFQFKENKTRRPIKVASMEDLKLCLKPVEQLLKECPYDDEDFKEISIAPATWKKMYELSEMEKNRYSFFDELYARKYVTDSMEFPRYNDDVLYLIEADDTHYRSKIEYGRVVFKTKHIYTGNFVDWYFQGPGRYVWLDGGVYQGDFENGVMHGQGTFLWPDGSIYDGQFQEGVRKGWGIYTTSKGYIFTGNWLNGVPNGSGKIWYDPVNNPENYYEGNLFQGLPDGFGTRQYGNGDIYVGTWSEGSRSGQGTMLWRDQKQMYRGEWAEGVPHGQGIQVWYLPVLNYKENVKKYTRSIFKGSHESGVRHGKGTLFFPDASIYEGFWSKGRQLNDGVYTDPVGEFLLSLQCIQPDDAGFMEEIFDRSTFECIFSRLVKNLSERFPIKSKDPEANEERQITNICYKYLPELRLLYQRTVDLGGLWTNNSPGKKRTGPTFSGKNCFNRQRESKTQYGSLHNIYTTLNKLAAHDLIPPATKFGLWLFVKDCDNTMRHASMAHYNKYWHSYPSICFQDEHCPFEVVHFWQFVQCLVVVAFEMYAGIPFDKSRIKYKCDLKARENVDKEEKIINSGKASRVHYGKTSLSDDDFMDIPAAGDGAVGRAPSTLFESDENTETDEVLELNQKDSSDSDIASLEGIDCSPICLSEIFDIFVQDHLFGCFNHLAGTLLPPLPDPLPPMNDLYQGFKSIKNKGVISATDFLYSVLPHKIHPDNMQSTVYWTRTKQIASADVNLDELFNLTRNLQSYGTGEPEPELEQRNSNGAGAGDQLEKLSAPTEAKPRASTVSQAYSIEEEDSLTDIPAALKSALTVNLCKPELPLEDPELSSARFESMPGDKPPRTPRLIEETLHDIETELLIPDEIVTVDADSYKNSFKITSTDELRNLETEDVISVLRELYPDLIGPPTEICLAFDMIFCDWLWAVILCSNASAAKDLTSCRTCDSRKLRLPVSISKLQEEGLQIDLCCTSNRRGNNRKFYFQEILSTFLRHESIRRGELWPAENKQSGTCAQNSALSTSNVKDVTSQSVMQVQSVAVE